MAITHTDVAIAYALSRIYGGLPLQYLGRAPGKHRAVGAAILGEVIFFSHSVENGWLTPFGIDLLPEEMRVRYCEAILRMD